MIILTNVLRVVHGGWVNSENCYSPGLVAPTLLRPLILPSTGVWELAEGGRQGEDRRQRACSSWETTKGPRPASWSLGMSSWALSQQLIGPLMLQLWDYINSPKKEFGSMKIPKPPGLKGLMSPSNKAATISHSNWISVEIAWFVLKTHSKRNK